VRQNRLEQQKDLLTGCWRSVPIATPKEHELQIQLVTMLKWSLRPDVIMFHCPNGELRDKRAAAKLRAMGTLPGVPDLQFLWKHDREDLDGSHTDLRVLFLELKRPGGKLTTEQAAFGLAMRAMGADFEVASSIDEAIAAVGMRGLIRSGVEVCGRRWS
jgi:VRR-NUC domain-containing protein